MPTAPVNGIHLYYEVHGEGPTPIVFAHGASGNHLVWFQQIPYFSKKYRCITFDHRGFHLSPDLPNGPGVASFVDDLRGLLDYLGIEKTAIVAQSMAGITGFGFAITHPERVKALVMSGTVQGIPTSLISEAIARFRKVHTVDKATDDNYATYFPEREPAREFLYREITMLNSGYGKKQLGATRPARRPDSDLAKLTAPVMFVFGADDEGIPPEIRQIAHNLIPGSRYVEVAGSGHSPYFERPDEFNRVVAGFLDEVGA